MNRTEHLSAIRQILNGINQKDDNPFILKGDTALFLCYSFSHFSEDIYFDAASNKVSRDLFKQDILKICKSESFFCQIIKDTATTQRIFVNYGIPNRPIKIEVSYRRKDIPQNIICNRNAIQVYTLSEITRQKATIYLARDKIRDLYDISYICTHCYDELDASAKDALRSAFEFKDLEQFDYIVQQQKDELIDPDVLKTMFLESFEILGLLTPYDI